MAEASEHLTHPVLGTLGWLPEFSRTEKAGITDIQLVMPAFSPSALATAADALAVCTATRRNDQMIGRWSAH